jgi:serine/threonine protein kinase
MMFEQSFFPSPRVLKAHIAPGVISHPFDSHEFPSRTSEAVNVLYSASGARYELCDIIKEAIYGAVIKARLLKPASIGSNVFIRTNIQYAVKIYSKHLLLSTADYTNKENPLAELAALQFIGDKHSNIIEQIECCADEQFIFSILRFYGGGELFDYVAANGRVNEIEAKVIFYDLLKALLKLRELGIIHRDISLENMLYLPSTGSSLPQVVLIDFGMCQKLPHDLRSLVTLRASQAQSNIVCGKRSYIAPEILAHGNSIEQQYLFGHASDLWSAGICLLYMLLGFPPFEYAKEDDIRYVFLLRGKLRDLLAHWNVEISEEALDFIQCILRSHPADRPNIEELFTHPWMRDVHDMMCRNSVSNTVVSTTTDSINNCILADALKKSHQQTLVAA